MPDASATLGSPVHPGNQRQQLLAERVGARHARRGKTIERLQLFGLACQRFRRRQASRRKIRLPHQLIEQRRHHHTPQRLVIGRRGVALRTRRRQRTRGAFDLVETRGDGGQSGDGDDATVSRGVDLRSLIAAVDFSACVVKFATSLRSPATDCSIAVMRPANVESTTAGTAGLDSMVATRAASASTLARSTCGAAGTACGGGDSQPAHDDTPTAPPATIAPTTAATIADGIHGRPLTRLGRFIVNRQLGLRRRFMRFGRRSGIFRGRCPTGRDRWSAACAWDGPNPAAARLVRACHRPSRESSSNSA